ncbi:MAG: hypothetical protein ABI481_11430 [Pyrinomonadaceae bacterium]
MECEELKLVVDSYLSDELLVETNHEVQRHLELCASCRSDFGVRQALRSKVRAVLTTADDAQIDPRFAARLTRDLRRSATSESGWSFARIGHFNTLRFASLAFIVGVLTVVTAIYLRPSVETVSSSGTDVAIRNTGEIAWQELAHTAIGDHENCAITYRLSERPITLQAAAIEHGKFNEDLDKIVMEALGRLFSEESDGKIEFLEAHYCIYAGQQFAHIVVRQRGRKASILIADTASADTAATESLAGGGPGVSGFNVRGHAVFVVSELPQTANSEIANALRPVVRSQAEKFGV